MALRLLVVSSETPDQQDDRRKRSGSASHETYIHTLKAIDRSFDIDDVCCVETRLDQAEYALQSYDGVVFAGSPIQMYKETAETRAAAHFMSLVFEAGTPSFGSCAGLQIAAVAAGGFVRQRSEEIEAGFARGIWRVEAGHDHFLLRGRPGAWDAPAMHASMVDRVPAGGKILARTRDTPVEAAEISCGQGRFFGVQYHPEISLTEIGEALQGQAVSLVQQSLARDTDTIETYAAALATLDADPDRRDLAWQLGLDREVLRKDHRQREITNFLNYLRG